ncbi:MAG: DUF4397 domain-containing protein [Gemmatimonadaceae bacterium]
MAMTNRYRSLAALLGAVLLASCGKDAVQTITAPATGASIKFFNFGVNAPSVNFYANDTKMTAVSSTSGTESTTGTSYGGAGNAGLYSNIAPGPYTFSGRIAATTDKNLPISNLQATLEDGKYYSFYQSGFYDANAKTIDGFLVEDPFPAQFDFSVAYVRFVNAISNSSPMTLYAMDPNSSAETAVGAEVPYKSAGAFTALPNGVYNLGARTTGSTTNVLSRNTVSFVGGRVYTITARGDINVASTSTTTCASTNKTCLDNTTNR